VGSPDQQAFSHRVKKMCGAPKAFLSYKTKRRVILEDKEGKAPQGSPYHLSMLKEWEEERIRKQREAEEQMEQPWHDNRASMFSANAKE